jgi:DegV family protein with EDD domain
MGKVAIVTDSTADLPAAVVAQHDITVVPLSVVFGDRTFDEGVDIGPEQFLELLRSSPTLPTTAHPPSTRFEELYRSLAKSHDEIVSVHISGRLSGTVGSAEVAAAAVAGTIPVHVVDSRSSSLSLGFQAVLAAELAQSGTPAASIADQLRADTGAYEAVFFPETLEYLQRGGRVGKAQALVGSVLSLKPILRMDEGLIVPHERTRTRSRAIHGLLEFVQHIDQVSRIGVMHSGDLVGAQSLAARLQPLTPESEVIISHFGCVLLTHLGPGAMGVALRADR